MARKPKTEALEQTEGLEARDAVAANHEVVVHVDADRVGRCHNLARDRQIGRRRLWIAAWMIVQKSRRGRLPLNYLRKSVRIGRKGAVIGYSLI